MSMMGIVHAALRRDLTRCGTVLSAPTPPADRQRAGLAAHLFWMLDFLDGQHEGEDSRLWPLVRSLNPSAEGLLLQIEHDHAEIAPTIMALMGRSTAMLAMAALQPAKRSPLRGPPSARCWIRTCTARKPR